MAIQSTEVPASDILRRMHFVGDNRPVASGRGTPFYSLYIVDIEAATIVREFGFDVAPQSIRIQENGASDVVALQEGGYWIDERGQYFKNVNVSGTFGFRPSPQVIANTNPSGFRVSANQQLNSPTGRTNIATIDALIKERTGYDRFNELQNFFRFYWDNKKYRATAASHVMVWANWKMGEVYICRPVNFNRERNSPSNKNKINYNFALQTLAPLDIKPRDFLPSPARRQDRPQIKSQLQRRLGRLETRMGQLERFTTQAFDLQESLSTSILEPIQSALNSAKGLLDQVVATGEDVVGRLAEIPLQALREVHRACLTAASVADALLSVPERTSRLLSRLGGVLKSMARDIQSMFVSMAALSPADINDSARAFGSRYTRSGGDSTRSIDGIPISRENAGDNGTNTALGSQLIASGQRAVQIPRGVSIKAMALDMLGSAGRWKEIALLNGLRQPYISPGGDGITVLRPGVDTMLIPVEPESGTDVNQVFGTRNDVRDSDRYRYGTDLAIDESTGDLLVDSRGDIATISGLDNLRQSARIKVRTDPGDLVVHPWFGFAPAIGEGLSVDVLSRFYLQFRSTASSETRIASIQSLSMQVDGDVLLSSVVLVPKDSDDGLAMSLGARLRR